MKSSLRVALGIGAAGLASTLCLFWFVRATLLDSFRNKLSVDVSTRAKIIEQELQTILVASRAIAASVAASGALSRPSFADRTQRLLEESPVLRTITLVRVVPREGRAGFVQESRRRLGDPGFDISEGAPGAGRMTAGERPVYYPVADTYSRDSGAAMALGYDLGSSPPQLAALERVRDSGEAVVAERLPQAGSGGAAGFILLVPYYDLDRPGSTVAQRRAALRGFIQTGFLLEDLVPTALRDTQPVGLPFELLDFAASPQSQVIYRWSARLRPDRPWTSLLHPADVTAVQTFAFAGREWGIRVSPNAAYLARNYPFAQWTILPVGAALSLLLGALQHAVLARRERLAALNCDLEAEAERRRESEAALRVSERKYRIVADNTLDWEFWLAADGRFIYTSISCERVTGHSRAEFLEDQALLVRILHPDDVGAFERHRAEVTTRPEVGWHEFRVVRPDGVVRWLEHVCQPVFDDDGSFSGTRGSNRDVTDRKRIETEREELIAELQAAQRNIRTLEGILPICSACKKIREADGSWTQIESYVRRRTAAEFTHGICPDCRRVLYPEFFPD